MIRSATLTTLSAIALYMPANATAQTTLPLKHPARPTQAAITTGDAMTRLYIFADDSMMGRSAGSEGDRKATAYIERELSRMGLQPAGENGTFFQTVPLYKLSLDMTSTLAADGTALVAGQDYFPFHPGGVPRDLDGAQIVFAGSPADTTTLVPASRTAGKVVILSGPGAGMLRRYPDARAFIVPIGEQQVPQLRAAIQRSSQGVRTADDTATRPMTIAVPRDAIAKFLGVPLENARPGTTGRTFRGAVRYTDAGLPAKNVVAVIPGSDPKLKGQYVAIGAHSDHVGLRRAGAVDHDSLRAFNQAAGAIVHARTGSLPDLPGSGLTGEERAGVKVNVDSLRKLRAQRLDSIYNGADDDASGSIGVLEIAEKFASARVKPKRSLLFVWHTDEESGLNGSRHFTDNPTVPRDSIVAQLNVDMIGRGEATDTPGGGPDYIQLLGSRRLSTEFGDLIESVNRSGKHNFRIDYQFDANGHPQQYYCRSDHYEYARYGIPIVFMSTGGHADYHQVTDEPQYINYPHLVKVLGFMYDVAEAVGNLDHRLVVDKPKPDPKARCQQ